MAPDTAVLEAENPRAVIGGNKPPSPIDDWLPRNAKLVEAADIWLKALEQPVGDGKPPLRKITTEDQAAKAQDFIEQIRKEWKACDDARKAENKPHDDAIKANNEAFRPLLSALEVIANLLKPLQSAWLQEVERRQNEERIRLAREAEQKRKDAEAAAVKAAQATSVQDVIKADRAQREAEQAAAAARVAQKAKPQVHGDYSTRAASLKTYWSAKITDYDKALQHYGKTDKVRDLIQSLADTDARSLHEALQVPGVEPVSERR